MRKSSISLALTIAALAIPATASAQWRFTTFAGAYLPANEFAEYAPAGSSGKLTLKQQTGFAIGLNGSRWFGRRFGVEGTFGYVMADVKASESGPGGSASETTESYLVQTAAKLLFRLTPFRRTEMYLGAGPALFFSGGDPEFNGATVERDTEFGGAATFGTRVPLNQSVALRLGVDGYFYPAKAELRNLGVDNETLKFDSRFQSDFVLSAGLSFALPMR